MGVPVEARVIIDMHMYQSPPIRGSIVCGMTMRRQRRNMYQSPYKGFNSFERGFLYANFHISDSCINPPIRGSIGI